MILKTFVIMNIFSLTLGCAGTQNTLPSQDTITPDSYYSGGASDKALGDEHLDVFDELDFDVFSNQDWSRLHHSHDENIIVTWPDGHSTHGIDIHIEDLKKLFVHAPDTEIKLHPVRIASGNWTSVIGVMTGTFTKPMPIGDGKFIQPTGKRFELSMSTVAFWKDGRMVHEWLFWDNATYAKQMGLGD